MHLDLEEEDQSFSVSPSLCRVALFCLFFFILISTMSSLILRRLEDRQTKRDGQSYH